MNIRLKCSCGARFTTSDQILGQWIRCPKCQRRLRVPVAMTTRARDDDEPEFVTEDTSEHPEPVPLTAAPAARADVDTTWRTHGVSEAVAAPTASGRGRWFLLFLVLLVPIAVVGLLIAWPLLQPMDSREVVAEQYLHAIRRGDWAEANRLSVLTTHPRPTRVEHVSLTDRELPSVQGNLLGLAELHTQIERDYRFNSERGRYEPKDEAGLGLEVLSQLEKAKQKIEQQTAADKARPRSRNPEDQMLDDVLARYGAIAEMASNTGGLLSSQRLGPTYDDLLERTDIELSEGERLLAEHYAANPAKWDRLLGRSFLTLPPGEFSLEEAQIQARIRTEGQSFAEPGKPLTVRMIRFSMGTLDTGWRVWQVQ